MPKFNVLSENLFRARRWLWAIAILSLIAITFGSYSHYRENYYGNRAFPNVHAPSGYSTDLQVTEFTKPEGVNIIGLVFFGRRNRVEMMRCYLERNLVDNGGWLDEVHWVKNTDNKEDLAYLDEILASSPRYKKIDLSDKGVGFIGYGLAWANLERGNMYVKIDDDVVWFADDTIPRLVTLKMSDPQKYLVTSANLINSPLMTWVHYHLNAFHPYLPEFNVWEKSTNLIDSVSSRKSWRYTDYPYWKGPDDYYVDIFQDPPYEGHRWLRLENDSDIHRTPIVESEYKTWGNSLMAWTIPAQAHYSFLENLADDNLHLYKMGKAWITDYKRLSINFICVWADDVLDNLPMDTVDEEWLTINLPKKLGRSVGVETDALAVHFAFGGQGKFMMSTDLLQRYHDYAAENACARRV